MIRYQPHYNWKNSQINQTIINLIKIYSALSLAEKLSNSNVEVKESKEYKNAFDVYSKKASGFINSDLNTPGFFSVVFDIVRKFNLEAVNKKPSGELKYFSICLLDFFNTYGGFLGLFQESKNEFILDLNLLILKNKNIDVVDIEGAIEKRDKARKQKDYILSDKIRDKLNSKGIELKDNPDGTTGWSVRV